MRRTPEREALISLKKDGLVVVLPQRETVVSQIQVERVRQERFMRKSLELAVIELFMQQKTFEQLQELNELVEKQIQASVAQKYEQLQEYDDAFHRIFFEKSGQGFSWDMDYA